MTNREKAEEMVNLYFSQVDHWLHKYLDKEKMISSIIKVLEKNAC